MKHMILSLAAAVMLGSCSDIADDDRFIAGESVAPQRAVLIEDFTGQLCVNCPSAHRTLELLVEQYGDAVIPVSIHAGSLSIAASSGGLMQPEGNTYNDTWGINEWPKGVVNRTGAAVLQDEWPQLVRTQLALESPVGIEVGASCDDGRLIDIDITLRPTADIDAMLQVWILEDGIVALQRDLELGLIRDYVHNHVYRASVNGVGGERVVLRDNIHTTIDMECEVRDTEKEKWVPANLTVVAFIYNNTGVLQAAKAKVSTPATDENQ